MRGPVWEGGGSLILSNREIGQRLYVSHRTIGAHLYRIFPKLGITARGELETALSASTTESRRGAGVEGLIILRLLQIPSAR